MKSPLAGRPGLITERAETNALSHDLGQLLFRHGLTGCVLLSFKGERVGINSSADGDGFGKVMERLADQILAAFDSGEFDGAMQE